MGSNSINHSVSLSGGQPPGPHRLSNEADATIELGIKQEVGWRLAPPAIAAASKAA